MRTVAAVCIALALSATHTAAQAAGPAYPVKPIRMTVSSGAGGGLDLVARLVATPMGEALGQNIVVDNRPGASGSIAAEVTSHAAPDGYTLMVLSASLVVYGTVNKTRYDLYRDFSAVSQIAASPYLLTVHPSVPAGNVAEFIRYAKANPQKVYYASTGTASLAHLAGALFGVRTGTELTHVPYKGVGAALADMLSGQIQMSFFSGGSVYRQVRSQKLRALGVASAARSPLMPELPTLNESGVPDFTVTQWHGLMAPAGTPPAIIDRLQGEVAKAIQRSDVSTRLGRDGTETIGSKPADFAAFLRAERDKWTAAGKAAKVSGR